MGLYSRLVQWVGKAVFVCVLMAAGIANAESICAVVKIQIDQELTLERQAFDAEMSINNALDDLPLENVLVEVNFEDDAGDTVLATSDPNNLDAKFYIRIASLDQIDGVDGNGTIAPGVTAVANWLIIPSPGAALELNGTLYFVGATLTYDVGGKEESITVASDSIVVKPLPLLTLDYFLEHEVIADDAFTPEIEPAVPFTLGVRVSNNGQAAAANVSIDSAQPKIIENEQGLLIGFEIISSFVADEPAENSLLINFGDVPAENARTGRWQMVTNLSGEFTEFTAEFTHADEFGGELTSLLEATNTHLLIKDVLVDFSGRDGILDFLADDGDAIRVYESDNVDSDVENQSSTAALSFVANTGAYEQYTLNLQSTGGFVYAKISDTFNFNGTKIVQEAFRSDGKQISPNNIWFSQTRNQSEGFDHFLNIFDSNSTGQYTVVLGDKIEVPQPPALQFIPDRDVVEGNTLSYLVEASDPNGTIPTVTVEPLPVGATFVLDNTDNGLATYIFTWTPATNEGGEGQAGRYDLNYIASDGLLSSNRRAIIDVLANNDSDGDGMDDQWEMDNFGTLDRDGTGDFDGDGISDLDEFLLGSDPRSGPGTGPSIPLLSAPLFGAKVDSVQPSMVVTNSSVSPPIPLQYEFEVYTDSAMSDLVVNEIVDESLGITTSYQVPFVLDENSRYYWRARAFDGVLYSLWMNGEFFVDSVQEAPGAFNSNSPTDGSDVGSVTPTLEVTNSVDPDLDPLVYTFEVFADASLTTLVVASPTISEAGDGTTSWQVSSILTDNTLYYWHAIASDDDSMSTASPAASFFVNTENDAPTGLAVLAPADGSEVNTISVDLSVVEATDPDSADLLYVFDIDTVNTFDSPDLLSSGQISATTFSVFDLQEDMIYFWRARVSDGFSDSDWVTASFNVNADNIAPPIPTISNPGEGAWVATVLPTLSVNAVADPDGDAVSYRFQVYLDSELTVLVEEFVSADENWLLTNALSDNTWYYWRVQAEDENAAASAWSIVASFFANDNGVDDAPTFEFVSPSLDATVDTGTIELSWSDSDPDSSATIALYYDTDNTGSDGTLIVGELSEDANGSSDTYTWDVSAVDNGTYYVYALVADTTTTVTSYSLVSITVANPVNQVPSVVISSPLDTSSYVVGEVINLVGSANDPEDGDLDSGVEWSSDLDGILGSGASVSVSSLQAGAHTLSASVTDSDGETVVDTVTITINVPTNELPSVTITAPAADSVFSLGEAIVLTATASDAEDGDLSESVQWSSSLDGELGAGSSLSVSSLQVGEHSITASISDSDGASSAVFITLSVTVLANQVPIVLISSPIDGSNIDLGDSISLIASGTDAEDGDLSASLSWSSSLDGELGVGASLTISTLQEGVHVLSANVTDSGGASASNSITITVLSTGGVVYDERFEAEDSLRVLTAGSEVFRTYTGQSGTGAIELPWNAVGYYEWTVTVPSAANYTLAFHYNRYAVATSIRSMMLEVDDLDAAEMSFTGTGNTSSERFNFEDLGVEVFLAEGTHTIRLKTNPTGGVILDYMDVSSDGVTVPTNTSPVLTLTSPADGSFFVEGDVITFTAEANDTEDGVLSGSISWSSSIDGALGDAETIGVSSLSVGVHSITASVTDSGGETDSQSITVTVTSPLNELPSVGITSPLDQASVVLGEDVNLLASATDPEDGDISASIQWTSSLDGAVGSGASIIINTLQEGTHTLTASITDSGGATVVDTVDITVVAPANAPPIVTITAPATDSTFEQGETIAMSATASDAEDGDISESVQWSSSLDGVLGTASQVQVSSLQVGVHILSVNVTDSGGASASNSITITVLSIGGVAHDERFEAEDSLRVLTAGSEVFRTYTGQSGTGAIELPWNAVGYYEWTVTVPSAANYTLAFHYNRYAVATSIRSMMLEVDDLDAAEMSFTGTGNTTSERFNFEDLGVEVFLAEGTHTIRLKTNPTGGVILDYMDVSSDGVTAPTNTPPVLTLTSPADGSFFVEGDVITFTAEANDTEDGVLSGSISWSSSIDGALGDAETIGVSSLSLGVHSITASVTDSGGETDSQSITVTVTSPLNELPSLGITSPLDQASVVLGEDVNLLASATDPEDGDISASIQWTSSLDGAVGSGASVIINTLQEGTHTLTASITDSGGATVVDTVDISVVAPANAPPIVTITAPATDSTFEQGETIVMSATASDAEDGDISESVQWSSSIDGVLGTASQVQVSSLQVGVHSLTASVTDSGGETNVASITITVTSPVNQLPTVLITSPTDASSVELGDPISLIASATDAEDGDLNASLSWSSNLDGELGVGASLTISTLQEGVHILSANVTDSGGASASNSITITVLTTGGVAHDERFEAEDSLRVLTAGSEAFRTYTGQSGTGAIDIPWDAVGYFEWTVTVPSAANYTLAFHYNRYAVATSIRSMMLEVDDLDAAEMSFTGTGNTTSEKFDFEDLGVEVFLAEGTHTIRLKTNPTGGVILDYLDVSSN